MASCLLSLALLSVLLPTVAGAATVASVFGGRVPCAEESGIQFCAGSLATRVPSWDGVPLDVNVTLPPAAMDGPFPLIVELHGWSLGKTPTPFVDRALAGYIVLSYSARGFQGSCGTPASRAPDPTLANPNACLERGWVRLADARYEGRDTQHLAGLLVDEGLVSPDRIGVTGASYGGGQSMILAALHDRVMLPDGTLVPWQSPGGLPMTIAAAAPQIPWSNLAEALAPAGRTLDYRSDNPYGTRAGIQKQSWNALLYALGLGTGFYVPAGADPEADLPSWNARLSAGEPYDGEPVLEHALAEISSHHSAYGIDDAEAPAPLFIYNAWTDDLFPADEALRFYRKLKAHHPDAEIALHFADGFGHPRAGLGGDTARVQARIEAFFARHLLGSADPLPPAVETFTQGCNGTAVEGPFTAPDWDALHPGEVRFAERAARRFTSEGGSAATAKALDPLGGGPCRTVPAVDDPGAATYRFAAATGSGYTLMGAPTVIANVAVSGSFAQVAARLWDVAPDGTQALVAHSFYRPRSDNLGPQVFQLHPNGWHFVAGHAPKLELLGQSVPYGRAPGGDFAVTVRNLELRLPVLEAADGRVVRTPAPAVPPPSAIEPPDSGPPSCPATPDDGCAAGVKTGSGTLAVTPGTSPDDHRIAWRWRRSPRAAKGEFGDPRATTAYRLCVYGGGGLALAATLPAGGTCGGVKDRPCWRARPGGFGYADPAGTPDGVTRVFLTSGGAGKAHISLRATVAGAIPAPPLTVQLRSSLGTCWQSPID
jgi:predicted acyl esterase